MIWFALWREYKLSTAEILAVFPEGKTVYFNKDVLILDLIEENEVLQKANFLWWTIKIFKIIETDNLKHRFNLHILDSLQVKSNVFDDGLYINKNIITRDIVSYKNRFPSYYTPEVNYKKAIDDLLIYIETIKVELEKLEVFPYTSKDKTYDFYNSNHVKKILDL